MKKAHFLITVIAVAVIAVSCKKVELEPAVQSPMLPLAVGNTWTYVDSLIVTSDLPSSDTLVKTIHYEVTRHKFEDYMPRQTATGKDPRKIVRIECWEMVNTDITYAPATLFVHDGTVYASPFYPFYAEDQSLSCNHVSIGLLAEPELFYTKYGNYYASMKVPNGDDPFLQVAPMFHDLPGCITGLGPVGYQRANFAIPIEPLPVNGLITSVTTPAGTFSCIDFGTVKWATGVGMISSYHEAEAAFKDHTQHLKIATLHWKRTLTNYHLE